MYPKNMEQNRRYIDFINIYARTEDIRVYFLIFFGEDTISKSLIFRTVR